MRNAIQVPVGFYYVNNIFSGHLEWKSSHMDVMKWQGVLDQAWWITQQMTIQISMINV